MSELRDLYQEVILDHGRNPRNASPPDGANHSCDGHNPLCGDHFTVHARVADGVLEAVGFEGAGCAISTAAASTMSEAVRGLDRAGVQSLFDSYHALVTGDLDSLDSPDSLGKLAVFGGVGEFPMRVKCATLAWHTLLGALDEDARPVTTE